MQKRELREAGPEPRCTPFAHGHASALLKSETGKQHEETEKDTRRCYRLMLCFPWAVGVYGESFSSLRSLTGQREETMSFLAWSFSAWLQGSLPASLKKRGEGILLDILLGVVGAFAGGWLFHIFAAPGVSGLNLYSLLVAVLGSVVFLVLYHAIRPRRSVVMNGCRISSQFRKEEKNVLWLIND
jgi:uncharacterized membrane protein YeaQ/YmgE (transglycosylase-associated protein family)